MNTTLSQLVRALANANPPIAAKNLADAPGTGDIALSGADSDSRVVAPGHLFICKGAAFKPAYLRSAIDAGAAAYLCDASRAAELAQAAPGVPALVVADADLRRAMAVVSAEAWGHPDRDLEVVGITGTKGKTTTSYMLRSILDHGAGKPAAAVIGSIHTFDGVVDEESHNTTPEAPDLWRHLANARDTGLRYLDMEVSSQALKYDRTYGLHLDVAAFLNIGRDHISPVEHPTFEDYFESKLRIFDQARLAIVNLGSDHAEEILARAGRCEHVLTISADPAATNAIDAANYWAEDVASDFGRVRFHAFAPSWDAEVVLNMPGLFNVENALAAIAIADALEIPQAQIVAGLAEARVPGRMELIPTDSRLVCGLVDYAHNRLSYQKLFSSLVQEFPGAHFVAVLGAPGGKALERRRELPEEGSRWCDHLIYTEEDPGPESAADICAEMVRDTPAGQSCEAIPSRPDAIARAVDLAYGWADAGEPAVVCLLAKGDEVDQHEGPRFVPMEPDGAVFRACVARHGHTAS